MAERKSLLPPSPRGNASKGGLRSVLFSMRGAVSPSHRHRVRAVGFRSRARGVFGAPQPAQEGKMVPPPCAERFFTGCAPAPRTALSRSRAEH